MMQTFDTYDGKVLFFLVSLMFLALLTVMRERHDAEWCRKKFVGKLRPMLQPPEGVLTTSTARQDALHLAGSMLREHCRSCGQCNLAKLAPP
jgi:hypothetical protein